MPPTLYMSSLGDRSAGLVRTLLVALCAAGALAVGPEGPANASGESSPGDDSSARIPIGESPVRGPDDATVTVVAFCDFQTRKCQRAVEMLKKVQLERPESVRVVWKHLPHLREAVRRTRTERRRPGRRGRQGIASEERLTRDQVAGPLPNVVGRRVRWTAQSVAGRTIGFRLAAESQRVAAALREVGHFWESLPTLIEADVPAIDLLADTIERDRHEHPVGVEAIEEAYRDTSTQRARERLRRNARRAETLGVRSRPTFFVNGIRVAGTDEAKLSKAVDRALSQAESRLGDGGVARENLYRRAVDENLQGPAGRGNLVEARDKSEPESSEEGPERQPRSGEESGPEANGEPSENKAESDETSGPIENADFERIDAGYMHTCGIKTNGKMRCWGQGSDPESGGVGHNQADPPPGRYRQVSGGYDHTCAIRTDGRVDCWSYLYTDEFPTPFDDKKEKESKESDLPPRQGQERMLPDGKFRQIDATETRTCGIREDGTTLCWSDDPESIYAHRGPIPLEGNYEQISVERAFVCGLKSDGSIRCEGDDGYGRASPPDGRFVEVVTGATHGCARWEDGSVECWGRDYNGQASPPDGEFRTIDADGDHSCGVRRDGTIECWGLTARSGDSQQHDDYELAPPPDGEFRDVTVGLVHNCALREEGSVVCWGVDTDGQIGAFGEGYDNARKRPPSGWARTDAPEGRAGVEAIGETVQKSVAVGLQHGCAVRKKDGGIDCWGDGTDPEVEAEGGTYDYDRAYPPDGAYRQVVAGRDHSCGLREDGWVDCWGKGVNTVFNQLGEYNQAAPKAGRFEAIASGSKHVCGLRPDGSIDCWGRGYTTEPGSTGWNEDAGKETASPPSGSFVAIAAEGVHNCVRDRGGRMQCWTLRSKYGGEPLTPPEGVRFRTFDISSKAGCGITREGEIRCWGQSKAPPSGEFEDVAVGDKHACGLRSDGVAVCWGDNDVGQTIVPRAKFRALYATRETTCGLLEDGSRVRCWGGYGSELIPPGQEASDRPIRAGDPVGLDGEVVEVATGRRHTCARTAAGSVHCWGANEKGQLGAGDTKSRAGTVAVGELSEVDAIAAGETHTCAATGGGEVYCWGLNDRRQVGVESDGESPAVEPAPVRVPFGEAGPAEIAGLEAGADHTCVAADDGSAYCWGANHFGQLGRGGLGESAGPGRVGGLSSVSRLALDKHVSTALRRHGDLFLWGSTEPGPRVSWGRERDLSPYYLNSPPKSRENAVSLPGFVQGVPPARDVAAGKSFACVRDGSTAVKCVGSFTERWDFSETAEKASWPGETHISGPPLRERYDSKARVIAIDGGRSHVCAVLAVGTTYCWGGNRRGQLGSGDTESKAAPTRVDNIEFAASVAAGPLHTCVVTHRGEAKCWGDNRYGQLGRADE